MIGIFDSGSGGLSVLAALKKRAPNLDVVYFGDLANMPYGGRSQENLRELTVLGFEILRAAGATQLVSACNSVSAAVVRPFMHGEGVIEMVGPAARELARRGLRRVAIVATPATVESGIYETACAELGVAASMIAVSGLAAAIELENFDAVRAEISLVAEKILDLDVEAVLLGCTHYPFARHVFEKFLEGKNIEIIDPADGVAEEIVEKCGVDGNGELKILISTPSEIFEARVQKLFGNSQIVHS
ncbi:MAG: aspartate/glutamate racemase family protein [Candidatus Magasanikbacteria bacterium]|nr:aspartate/glutamate racemase family protein [Candidatus Magasanikbacteria bacterium]